MIDKIMKNSGDKAYIRDIERLDRSAVYEEITMISNVKDAMILINDILNYLKIEC